MRHVEGMSYGWIMLAAIAIGLIAYGVFQLGRSAVPADRSVLSTYAGEAERSGPRFAD